MYDEWGNFAWQRAAVLALALAGALFLGAQLLGSRDQARLSGWGPRGAGVQVAEAAPASGGLSGVAEQAGQGMPGENRPVGNPLGAPNTVMTQGYGVGSHAPAEAWGAIDLAIDSNGDGSADPDGSWNQPIYATQSGVVRVTPNSYPAGNHIWVENDHFRTGYSHLADFAVESGQTVRRGDLIGYLGSSGMSSGPHLDYQVWEMRDGSWVNVNPLDYDVLDR